MLLKIFSRVTFIVIQVSRTCKKLYFQHQVVTPTSGGILLVSRDIVSSHGVQYACFRSDGAKKSVCMYVC